MNCFHATKAQATSIVILRFHCYLVEIHLSPSLEQRIYFAKRKEYQCRRDETAELIRIGSPSVKICGSVDQITKIQNFLENEIAKRVIGKSRPADGKKFKLPI